MDLRFHRSNFCNRFHEMIAKIVDLGFLASRFPTLSAFAASVPSLLLGQFFLFIPKDSFFCFGHRIIGLGIILSHTAPCTTRMHIFVFVRRFGLTARIHIDTPDLSFLPVFHYRGKISRVFPCWRRNDFVGVFAWTFSPAHCWTGPKELRNRVFFRGLRLFRAEERPWFFLLGF